MSSHQVQLEQGLADLVLTADGSPTLCVQEKESMHSLEGAFQETQYIYSEAIKKCIEHKIPLRFLSVGLGLGYVELAILCRTWHEPEVLIHSFEKEEVLRHNFIRYLNAEANPPLSQAYEIIFGLYSRDFGHKVERIRARALQMLETKQWLIGGELNLEMKIPYKYNCVLFDPFSAYSSPEFWTEKELSDFIGRVAADKCLFTTYAATGSLTRALQAQDFQVVKRPGFGKKRESTFAHRGFS